jgi:cellulose synthase operon protein YhjQ
MPVVCVASPKGGVGKTTLTASIGVALHRIGWRVLAIDFDHQNALRLHFELPAEPVPGIADDMDGDPDWTERVIETPTGVYLLPFGDASAAGSMQAQAHVAQHPGWLRNRLEVFFGYPDLVIIIDMPPGPSVYGLELDALADLHVAALLADAPSLALLPKLRQGDYLLEVPAERPAAIGYVLNQVEPQRPLCRDVVALSQDMLGDDLYGMVHRDEAVAEAAACQLTVLDYAPDSVASRDIMAVAERVHLGLAPSWGEGRG